MRHAAIAPLALAVLLLATPFRAARAADDPPPANDHRRALEFGVSGVNLTTFEGASLSLRRQTSEHAAWRYGLTLTGSIDHTKYEPQPVAGVGRISDDRNNNSLGAELSVARLTFFSTETTIHPYLGAGAAFGWNESLGEDTANQYSETNVLLAQNYQSQQSWGPTWRGFGLIGVEWVLDARFAVHGEYGMSVAYATRRTDNYQRQIEPGTTNEARVHSTESTWSIAGRGIHAGISVFW